MYDIVCSVDIGLVGGLAYFDTVSGELLSLYPMPTKKENDKNVVDLERLKFIMEIPQLKNDKTLVVLEHIHAFGNSGFGVGKLMEEKGVVMGLALGLGYDQIQIPPKEWQKHFDIVPPKDLKGTSAKKTKYLRRKWLKKTSLEVARKEFPTCSEKLRLEKSDGLADALLLGLYYIKSNP